jgi:hypothetical protein
MSAILSAVPTPHGDLLRRKGAKNDKLAALLPHYDLFVETAKALSVLDQESIRDLVAALNAYRRESIYVFEGGKNVPQETLRSSLLEEFFSWLFKDIFLLFEGPVPESFRMGRAADSYVKLMFAPRDFLSAFRNPNPRFTVKHQDFALGVHVHVRVSASVEKAEVVKQDLLLPLVAIECKTYLAKNHLDMCASTAAEIRQAAPYCMYLIATEFLKMDKTVTPEFSDVAEIFILCLEHNKNRKKRKSAGLPPHDVSPEAVGQLFEMVERHLRSLWWDPDSAVERGQIIARPF